MLAYSNSRLTRRILDLEDLIQLHERTGVVIRTVVSGDDDLSTADGRMVARIKASVDAAEAERTSERLARAMLQRARDGRPSHGAAPFGWQADGIHLEPAEASALRQACRMVLDGYSLKAVAAHLEQLGLPARRGGRWVQANVGRTLRNPRLAGRQVYHGRVMLDAAGRPVPGLWEPVLDDDTFDRLQLVLAAREQGGGTRPGHRRYLLSGLVRCGTCGARMYGRPTPTGHAYGCQVERMGHTVTIVGDRADDLVTTLVLARLADVELPAEPVVDDPTEQARTRRLEAIDQLVAELMAAFTSQQLPGSVVFGQVNALEAERRDLELERAAAIRAGVQRGPAATGDDFLLADLDVQRAVLATLVEAVVVAPASRRGEPFNPGRLEVVWRQDA